MRESHEKEYQHVYLTQSNSACAVELVLESRSRSPFAGTVRRQKESSCKMLPQTSETDVVRIVFRKDILKSSASSGMANRGEAKCVSVLWILRKYGPTAGQL